MGKLCDFTAIGTCRTRTTTTANSNYTENGNGTRITSVVSRGINVGHSAEKTISRQGNTFTKMQKERTTKEAKG